MLINLLAIRGLRGEPNRNIGIVSRPFGVPEGNIKKPVIVKSTPSKPIEPPKTEGTGKPKTDYDKLKGRLNERYKKFANDKKQNIPQTSKDLLPNELKHGKYGKLPNETGDNITGHHMPSNKYMQDEFGIKTKDSYAMFLEHPHPGQGGRHRRTFTYGLSKATRPEDFTLYKFLKPRDVLTFDINDLRRILKEDGLYNKATRKKIQEYIDYYKNYEHNGSKIFEKPK